jgi:antitoxin (DNA-binding transcriptional repressor) of toxin-antitoxin stability system
MKFLSVRDLRGKSAQVWKELPREKEMIVTSNGRPIAILSAVDESTLEESLAAWRRVRATQAVMSTQHESMRKGMDKISMEAVDAEIARTRKERRAGAK